MKPLKLFFALCLLFYAVSVKAQFTV
ncbi:MAG: hypothetical protein K0S32_2242, partial [Bacteroidetes bacterium]|nr:hypothetical protein [Bacteroidota bacterium]